MEDNVSVTAFVPNLWYTLCSVPSEISSMGKDLCPDKATEPQERC